jgi:hypothetical protein
MLQNGPTGHRLRSPVSITPCSADVKGSHTAADLIAFLCLVAFVLKFKSDHGRTRMTRLTRTIIQDGVLYFLVMAAFHIAIALSSFFANVISPFLVEILV